MAKAKKPVKKKEKYNTTLKTNLSFEELIKLAATTPIKAIKKKA